MGTLRRVGSATFMMALVLGGCGGADNAESEADKPLPENAAVANNGMANADHEFLGMMSDHHEGLVQMSMQAMEKATEQSTQADAHELHTKQAAERDSMVAMIQRDYQAQHQPAPMPKNVAQTDSLSQLSGSAYDRTYYRMVIDHHREGIGMIDQHLSHLTKPAVRQMAEKMKADQQREIQEFEQKMAALE